MDPQMLAALQGLFEKNNTVLKESLKDDFQELKQQQENMQATIDAQEAKTSQKIDALRSELFEEIAKQVAKATAANPSGSSGSAGPSAPPDAWAAAAAARFSNGGTGGNASQRRDSSKRYRTEDGGDGQSEDPRNRRNPLRLHIKGFAKKVAPSVHRHVWDDLAEQLTNLNIEGFTSRIGRFDYKFEVDFESEVDAKRAVEIINGARKSWTDPDTNVVSIVRAQTDKSPNDKKANKVYGELRKLLEAHIVAKGLDQDKFKVRTSGPKGPLYIEDGNSSFEVCTMHKHRTTEVVNWSTSEECFAKLVMTKAELEDMQSKAMKEACKWE